MSGEIYVMVLTEEEFSYPVHRKVRLQFYKDFQQKMPAPFHAAIVNRRIKKEELPFLRKAIKAHTLFFTDRVELGYCEKELMKSKMGKVLSEREIKQFLAVDSKFFYLGSSGGKLRPSDMEVSGNYKGYFLRLGNYQVQLQGEFGSDYEQIAFWHTNLKLKKNGCMDFWPEYEKEGDIKIQLKIVALSAVDLGVPKAYWLFEEEELNHVVTVENGDETVALFVCVMAKGKGKLSLGNLNYRKSRLSYGDLLVGGKRHVTSEREELFSYFDPGDLKPPLVVLFSDFKSNQGFEGLKMMREFGCPYLLLTDNRLEGGCFYLGSEEYIKLTGDVIEGTIKQLGFDRSEVVFAGISMGAYGAMFYGTEFTPKTFVLANPLLNLGSVAINEKRLRPGVFCQSIDILRLLTKGENEGAETMLNDLLWNRFHKAKYDGTTFFVAHMLEDDYDGRAYEDLLAKLNQGDVKVVGKGIHGRHNDYPGKIGNWFINRLQRIINEDYSRG